MAIPWVDPETHDALVERGDVLCNSRTGIAVAHFTGNIPRFVPTEDNYAESFGWQWNNWEHTRSEARGSQLGLRKTVLKRARFGDYDLEGKTILECGMGGGDDTEILLSLPFAKVHGFDMSSAVDRAARYLTDDRLSISQASIYAIPYPDEVFDFVYCHRVLQHTPDPVQALRCIGRKVKPGGVLFVHSYQRSWRQMLEWRYKYRWLTKRLPASWIFHWVERFGTVLHRINQRLYPHGATRWLAYNFLPFYHKKGHREMSEAEKVELEKLITFDALTPRHDHPMRPSTLRKTLASMGFEIEHMHVSRTSPVWCTAIRR